MVSAHSPNRTLQILLVEDDVVDRKAFRRIVGTHPEFRMDLLESETGREGLRLAAEHPVDCIVLDYNLPDLDGLSFLQTYMEQHHAQAVPVIMLTGVDNAKVAVEAMKMGARDFVTKDSDGQYLALLPAVIACALRDDEIRQARLDAEKKLVEAESRYRELVEHIPAITYLTALEPQPRLLYVSPQSSHILGYSADEWLADPVGQKKRIHPDDLQRVDDAYRHTLSTGQPFRCEYRRYARDGRLVWLRNEGSIVRDSSGRPLYLQGVLVDITQNKRTEEELRQHRFHLEELVAKRTAALSRANEQLRREIATRLKAEEALTQHVTEMEDLYNGAPCGYHSLDPKGRIVRMNDTELAWLGYRREEVLGRPFTDFITPEGRATFEMGFPQFKETGRSRSLEYEMVRKDGTTMPVLLSTTAVRDERGEFLLSRAMVFDLAERKRAEELRQSRKLLRQLAAHNEMAREEERKRIAREVHDELGQKLTALQLEVSLLQSQLGDAKQALGKKVGSILNLIETTMETVRTIASDLRPAVLDLGLIAAIEWQMQDFEQRTGIPCGLVTNIDEIELDDRRATAIFRILQESLTNVTRHANATQVTVSLRLSQGILAMTVEDDGVGIQPENTARPKSFGLAGIRERAFMLGGAVSIEGLPGRGTVVSVTIPAQSETIQP